MLNCYKRFEIIEGEERVKEFVTEKGIEGTRNFTRSTYNSQRQLISIEKIER